MAFDPRALAAPTVLAPPAGGRVERDLVYRTDSDRVLKIDVLDKWWRRGQRRAKLLAGEDGHAGMLDADDRIARCPLVPRPSQDRRR